MIEHSLKHIRKLLIFSLFFRRIVRCTLLSLILMGATIFVGCLGFCYFEKWTWLDAALNSILIMTGCGFNKIINEPATKVFASFYIVVSTMMYFAVLIILISPTVHRFMHAFHLEVMKNSGDR